MFRFLCFFFPLWEPLGTQKPEKYWQFIKKKKLFRAHSEVLSLCSPHTLCQGACLSRRMKWGYLSMEGAPKLISLDCGSFQRCEKCNWQPSSSHQQIVLSIIFTKVTLRNLTRLNSWWDYSLNTVYKDAHSKTA